MPATRTQRVRALEQRTQALRQAGDYTSNPDLEYVTDSSGYASAPSPDLVEFQTDSGLVLIVCAALFALLDASEGALASPQLDGEPLRRAFVDDPPEIRGYDIRLDPYSDVFGAEEVAAPEFEGWQAILSTGGGVHAVSAERTPRGKQGSFDSEGLIMLSVAPGHHSFELCYRAPVGGQLAVCDRRVLVVSL